MAAEFDPEVVKAQKCAGKGDWKGLKDIFDKVEDPKMLLDPFDLFGNTVIHAVARSGKAKLLRSFLEKLNEDDKEEALLKGSKEENSVLHEAVLVEEIETVDVIMEFGDKLLQNGSQELLQLKNTLNETPVFRAAKYGKLKILKHIHKKHRLKEALHFQPSDCNGRLLPILHNCLVTLNFVLPNEGYVSELELEDAANNSFKYSKSDLERGLQDDEIEKPSKSNFTSRNYTFWKFLAKGCNCNYINEIWEQKKKHKFAKHLIKLLVTKKDPLCKYNYRKVDRALCLIPDYPSNVTEKKRKLDLKKKLEEKNKIKEALTKKKKNDEDSSKKEKNEDLSKQEKNEENENIDIIEKETSWETPLFLATASGIKEVVEAIVDDFPEALSHVNDDGLNILHMAIKHRQLEIYEFIRESPAFEALKQRISHNGRTILHQAASMEYFREQALSGVAYQLQDELEWYDRVRSNVPQHYLMHCDKNDLAAGDLLDIEHAEMHDQAKTWMKETAQSCSTVAVLIAGVVFAAAYAIPGGNENGKASLSKETAFKIFTIMDVVALASSLGSVVMFLSILTSSFELWDFHKSLPGKLKLGFILLFFALITTMLAFAATILLTIQVKSDNKKSTFIYSIVIVVISLFGLTQFPIYRMLEDEFKKCSKSWQKK